MLNGLGTVVGNHPAVCRLRPSGGVLLRDPAGASQADTQETRADGSGVAADATDRGASGCTAADAPRAAEPGLRPRPEPCRGRDDWLVGTCDLVRAAGRRGNRCAGPWWIEPRSARRRRRQLITEVPQALEIIAACLGAGLPARTACAGSCGLSKALSLMILVRCWRCSSWVSLMWQPGAPFLIIAVGPRGRRPGAVGGVGDFDGGGFATPRWCGSRDTPERAAGAGSGGWRTGDQILIYRAAAQAAIAQAGSGGLSQHDTKCSALFLACDTALSRSASTARDWLDQPREPTASTASAHAGQRCPRIRCGPPEPSAPGRTVKHKCLQRSSVDGDSRTFARRCAAWRAHDKPGAGSRSSQAVNHHRAIARCGLEEWALLACTGGDSPHPGEDLARLAG